MDIDNLATEFDTHSNSAGALLLLPTGERDGVRGLGRFDKESHESQEPPLPNPLPFGAREPAELVAFLHQTTK
jgi:hypothetical protein